MNFIKLPEMERGWIGDAPVFYDESVKLSHIERFGGAHLFVEERDLPRGDFYGGEFWSSRVLINEDAEYIVVTFQERITDVERAVYIFQAHKRHWYWVMFEVFKHFLQINNAGILGE